jgi:Baculovirus LEF-11 protein
MEKQQSEQQDNQFCLSRSEVYALLRETINYQKYLNLIGNVCDHIFDEGFEYQIKYIRENIDRVVITVDNEQRKRLNQHFKKLNKLFYLGSELKTEYIEASTKYVFSQNNV